jgi:hypothetical protein
MVKRIKTQHNDHVCDDCKWREWHKQQWNLDRDGKPLTYHCTMGQFTHAEVRGRKACELWDKE